MEQEKNLLLGGFESLEQKTQALRNKQNVLKEKQDRFAEKTNSSKYAALAYGNMGIIAIWDQSIKLNQPNYRTGKKIFKIT